MGLRSWETRALLKSTRYCFDQLHSKQQGGMMTSHFRSMYRLAGNQILFPGVCW